MGTTIIRLDAESRTALKKLAPEFGGQSGIIRHAIRFLAADVERRHALTVFLDDWDSDAGPLDPDAIDVVATRYGFRGTNVSA